MKKCLPICGRIILSNIIIRVNDSFFILENFYHFALFHKKSLK